MSSPNDQVLIKDAAAVPQGEQPQIQFGSFGALASPVVGEGPPAVDIQPEAPSTGGSGAFSPDQVRALAQRRLALAARELSEVHRAQGLPDPLASSSTALRAEPRDVLSAARARPPQALNFSTPAKRSRTSNFAPVYPGATTGSGLAPCSPSGIPRHSAFTVQERPRRAATLGRPFGPARRYVPLVSSVSRTPNPTVSERRVSSDLPYSLVVSDAAGWRANGYTSELQALKNCGKISLPQREG